MAIGWEQPDVGQLAVAIWSVCFILFSAYVSLKVNLHTYEVLRRGVRRQRAVMNRVLRLIFELKGFLLGLKGEKEWISS